MLIYEAEGFLELEADSINQLCRSRDHITFSDSEGNGFDVHAILCDFQDCSQSRCYIAFHDKTLKKALVFSVRSPGEASAWQHGHEVLTRLGYRLDELNLKLSPAMLEVVLRDIPGLASPDEARRQKDEKARLLAEWQEAVETDPSSAAGRKAALRLGAEQRLAERVEQLRQLMIESLSPAEQRDDDSEAMMEQVRDLTARLEAAEDLVEQERKQREISESITEAAEKRIQELEEIFIEFETRSAGEIKQKRTIIALQKKLKEVEGQLTLVSDELAAERHKQEQFVTDVKQAHTQIAELEDSLQNTEQMLAASYDQLAQEQSLSSQLETSFRDAEGRIRQLEEEVQGFEEEIEVLAEQNARIDEADKTTEELQSQLAKLESEMRDLRQEHQQECTLRERLEKDATEDQRQIRELEQDLQEARKQVSAATAEVTASEQTESLKDELDDLKHRLREEQAGKENIERELAEAHKIIDSLEQMVRETEQAASIEKAERPEDSPEYLALSAEVTLLKEQIAQEIAKREGLAEEIVAAEKKLADRDSSAGKRSLSENVAATVDSETAEATGDSKPAKSSKPLPHELRPAPDKKALFHPDWDLEGLPCQSAEQVVRAWETVFNVQISLEGYPAQYCMAFLIVLRIDNKKKLFMVYRLKQSKHTLVCVPATLPANETELKKAIDEGLTFLQRSGFQMEKMPAEYISSSLGSYFLKG